MPRLYTKLFGGFTQRTSGDPTLPVALRPGLSVCPPGEVWVVRSIGVVYLDFVADRFVFSVAPAGTTGPRAAFYADNWSVTAGLPRNSQWNGHMPLLPGASLRVTVQVGNISCAVGGWVLRIPSTTTPTAP